MDIDRHSRAYDYYEDMRKLLLTVVFLLIGLVGFASCMTALGDIASQDTGVVSAPSAGAADSASAPAEAAHVGTPLTLEGGDGLSVKVTLVKVDLDATSRDDFSEPDPGHRYVAARWTIENVGATDYESSPWNGTFIIGSDGERYDIALVGSVSSGTLFPALVKINGGSKASGWIVYQVPVGAEITSVQFSTDSGFGQTGEWSL
jgi:hypothetical protein